MKTDLHKFPYQSTWIDAGGFIHPWGHLKDDHLMNIKKLLIRKGTGPESMGYEFPDKALYFCLREMKRRNKYQLNFADSVQFNKIKSRMKAAYFNSKKEEKMKSRYENDTCSPSRINDEPVPPALHENLFKAFGKKVRHKATGRVGQIIAVYHPDYSNGTLRSYYEINVKYEDQKFDKCLLDDVEVIQEVQLYLYEHKSGTVEWTSKKKLAAVLKKTGTKLLTTKMIEV